MLHNGHGECSGRLVPKNPSPTLAFHNCPRVHARQQETPASGVELLVCGVKVSALPSYGSTILCSHRANSHTLPMLAPASGFLGLCELPFPGSAQPETLQQLTLTEPACHQQHMANTKHRSPLLARDLGDDPSTTMFSASSSVNMGKGTTRC